MIHDHDSCQLRHMYNILSAHVIIFYPIILEIIRDLKCRALLTLGAQVRETIRVKVAL